MKFGIVCCVHGNETYGLEVIDKLPVSVPNFIANPMAVEKNKRFIDVDLNRCFPGKLNGNYEEVIADRLTNDLRYFDYILDLHSSSNNCPMFGIITKPNKDKIEFAKKLGLKRLVVMPEFFASGKALIDFVNCGISIEVGPHKRDENTQEVLELINNFLYKNKKNEDIEIYEVFDIIKKNLSNIIIENFEKIKKGQIIAYDTQDTNIKQCADFDFTAVLVEEGSYGDILCLACKDYAYDTVNLP